MSVQSWSRPGAASRATLLDWAERMVIVGLFGWLTQRLVAAWLTGGSPFSLLLVVSEGLVVAFVLFRRPATTLSMRVQDWALAAAATAGPMLVQPTDAPALVAPAFGGLLILCGLLIQFSAKLVLGRSFGVVAANRGVKVSGPYRLVRHPIYAGYLVTHVGYLLLSPSVWNLAVYVLSLAFQIVRLGAEERLLAEDPAYRAFMARVRHRLIPAVY